MHLFLKLHELKCIRPDHFCTAHYLPLNQISLPSTCPPNSKVWWVSISQCQFFNNFFETFKFFQYFSFAYLHFMNYFICAFHEHSLMLHEGFDTSCLWLCILSFNMFFRFYCTDWVFSFIKSSVCILQRVNTNKLTIYQNR